MSGKMAKRARADARRNGILSKHEIRRANYVILAEQKKIRHEAEETERVADPEGYALRQEQARRNLSRLVGLIGMTSALSNALMARTANHLTPNSRKNWK